MIQITPEISIDEKEIKEAHIHAMGPGGQNVNKVASAVQIRFDVFNSPSLTEDVRKRLVNLAGKKISENGILIIKAKRFRSQDRNRQDAVERLVNLIKKAARVPKIRRKTKPTATSELRRLDKKRRHGTLKQIRGSVPTKEDY